MKKMITPDTRFKLSNPANPDSRKTVGDATDRKEALIVIICGYLIIALLFL